jgi:hypothetical protein
MTGPAGYDLVLDDCGDGWYSIIDQRTHLSPCWESIEGTLVEMVELGSAIEARSAYRAKRCAVETITEAGRTLVRLWSPRNSRGDVRLTIEQASALARSIRQVAAEVAARLEAGDVG